MNKRHRYADDEVNFLKNIANNDKSREMITEMFNKEFNLNLSVGAVMMKCCELGLTKERTYRKRFEPSHKKSVDDEFICMHKNGRRETYIKVSEPNGWKLKSHVIWEKYNKAVPDGHIIIFLDGNTQNFDPQNLALVSRMVNARINQNKFRTNNVELTEVGI